MDQEQTNYKAELQDAIRRCGKNNFGDNWDYRRFGPELSVGIKQRIKKIILFILVSLRIYSKSQLGKIKANEQKLDWLYNTLADAESKKILIYILTFRMLGHRKVRLPLNTPVFWSRLDELEHQAENAEKLPLAFNNWMLSKLDLSEYGYPIQLFIRPSGVFTQLLLQQYRCQCIDRDIKVEPGDTVIDAGGCYGDTALYFAHLAGPEGQIYSSEFMPDNLNVFRRNLELNPELAGRIHIIENPLWSSSGEKLFIEGIGPAARITRNPRNREAQQTETLCIDDLVKEQGLCKVNFIKMDIEGAELEALKGAENTITRCRPKLAISVYHKIQDFWEIPQWIEQLGLKYRFYLRHFTIHAEETVLFAVVDD